MTNQTLQHVGVLGMKWGVHRRGPDSQDHILSRQLKRKRVSELSNDEIRKVTTRLQLEKQLKDLDPKSLGVGRKILSGLLQKFGPKIVDSFVKKYSPINMDDVFGGSGTSNPNIVDSHFID